MRTAAGAGLGRGGRGRGGRISCHFFQLFTPQVKSLAIFLEEVVAELPKLMRTAAGAGLGATRLGLRPWP